MVVDVICNLCIMYTAPRWRILLLRDHPRTVTVVFYVKYWQNHLATSCYSAIVSLTKQLALVDLVAKTCNSTACYDKGSNLCSVFWLRYFCFDSLWQIVLNIRNVPVATLRPFRRGGLPIYFNASEFAVIRAFDLYITQKQIWGVILWHDKTQSGCNVHIVLNI